MCVIYRMNRPIFCLFCYFLFFRREKIKKINFFLKKNIGIKHFLAYKKGSIYGNKQGVMKRVEQIRPQATPIPLCGNFAVFALGGYGLQSPTISLIFVVERKFTNQ